MEYKKVKEVFRRFKGTPITAGRMKEIEAEDGKIRVFAGRETVINAHEADIPNANIIRVPAILVQSRGVIDVVYCEKPLWVDKNLKMHGLIQAFSRTNRILNFIKTFENIVYFRNLQKCVDSAISLFEDKNAGGIIFLQSFKDYYYGYVGLDDKPRLGYVDMVEELTEKQEGTD